MEIWAVVVAGGSGTRFGRPKQLAPLGGRRVIDLSIDTVRQHVAGVVVVGSAEIGSPASLDVASVVDGGETRSESVRNGLAALPQTATHVMVHDAARPLASVETVGAVVAALSAGAEAVVPVVPVTDTLRLASSETGERVAAEGAAAAGGTVDRSQFVAVQTPQGFLLSALQAAHAAGVEATDDAGVVEAAGVAVIHVDGSPHNLKITFPHDLVVAEALLASLEQGVKE